MSSVWKRVSQRHVLVSTLFFSMYLLQGLNFASLGALLPELREQASISLADSGGLFGARGGGYMCGAILVSYAVDRVRGFANLLFAVAMVAAALATGLLTLSTSLAAHCVCVFVVGAAMGVLDAGANAVLVWELHGRVERVDPFLQAMHAGFALGSFISPLLLRYIAEQATSHRTAFYVLAGLYSYLPFALLLMGRTAPRLEAKPDLSDASPLERANSQRSRARRKRLEWALVATCSISISAYLGMESGGGGYLFTYAQELVQLPDNELPWLNATLWGTFFIGRVMSIALSTRVHPFVLLILAMVFSAVSMLIPLIFGHTDATVWASAALLGVSMATVFPSIFAFVEANLNLNAKSSAAIVVGGAIGDIVLPIVMGEVMAFYSLEAFPALVLSFIVLCAVGLVVSLYFARTLHKGTRFGGNGAAAKESLRLAELSPRQRGMSADAPKPLTKPARGKLARSAADDECEPPIPTTPSPPEMLTARRADSDSDSDSAQSARSAESST